MKNIAKFNQMMNNSFRTPKSSIDEYIVTVEGMLDVCSNSKIGRNGNSNKNELMSRPTLMYLWYLIKQGKIVKVEPMDTSAEAVSGSFLHVPMYDLEGKPTLEAIIPIVAKDDRYALGEYQNILFVDKLLDLKVLNGEFIQESYKGGSRVRKCSSHLEYLENINSITILDNVYSITDSKGFNYLAAPLLAKHTLVTITGSDGKPELYQIVGNPHSLDDLNDPNVEKNSDGYITQDIIIPMIHGIGAKSKHIKNKAGKEVSYRYSSPTSRFMALASLFVSHELYKGNLQTDPNNDMWKRKARVTEWDMIEGFNRSVVEPFEKLFPNADSLKVLTLAIDVFIFTILGDEVKETNPAVSHTVLMLFSCLFGNQKEFDLIEDLTTPKSTLLATKTWEWVSYFLSLKTSWENTPYVNHKDLRRSHNTMYNLEFTEVNFNDAHGALVGALASLPNGSQYVKTATVPCIKKVNGEDVVTTKQMQVFKNHYGISAYILYDYDRYMFEHGAVCKRGQFIEQLCTIARLNRKQSNSSMPKYLGIAPNQVNDFKQFLEDVYGYGTDKYWKLV